MKVLKVMYVPWKSHTRDIRELRVFKEMGAEVHVVSRAPEGQRARRYKEDGYFCYDLDTLPLDKGLKLINKALTTLSWVHFIRKFDVDVITAHNTKSLLMAWMAGLFKTKAKKPKLIYDCHEYVMAQNAHLPKYRRVMIAAMEKFLMKRCAFSIMVSDGIADEVQRIHRLKDRPVVLRSTPDLWKLDPEVLAQKRAEICGRLGIPKDSFIAIYQGIVMKYRGVEDLIEAMQYDEHFYGVIMGDPASQEYMDSLVQKAQELGVYERLLFLPHQPYDDIWKYTGACDCGLVVMNGDNPNYTYALPNKLFENIQSESPLIASDLVEISRIVKEYKVGLLVPYADPKALAEAIGRMREDKELYGTFKENLKAAKQELSWDNEREVLIEAVRKYCM